MPVDANADLGKPLLYQVDPFRAPQTAAGRRGGTIQFVISGDNLTGATKVGFGDAEVTNLEVTKTRIKGQLPELLKTGFTNVHVYFEGSDSPMTLEGAYHFFALADEPTPGSVQPCLEGIDGQICS